MADFLESGFPSFIEIVQTGTIEQIWSKFTDIVGELVGRFIPKRNIQVNSSRPCWFNKQLRNLERKV